MPFSQTMVSTDLSLWCFLTGFSYEKMKLVFVFKLFSDARRSRTSFTDYDRKTDISLGESAFQLSG